MDKRLAFYRLLYLSRLFASRIPHPASRMRNYKPILMSDLDIRLPGIEVLRHLGGGADRDVLR